MPISLKGRSARKKLDKVRKMKFEATEQQIKEIAVKAITYSKPLGWGLLEALDEIDIKPEDIKLDEYGLALDYVKGRCVKLFIRRGLPEGSWHIDHIADPEYQTWVRRYGSNETLVSSVLEDGKTNCGNPESFPPENFPLC
jgi:hypothetical protein